MDTVKLYVIADINWEYNDNWYSPTDSEPIKAFKDKDYAILYMQELEKEKRKTIENPREFAGSLSNATSLSESELYERIQAMYLPLPISEPDRRGSHSYDFYTWWNIVKAHLDESNLDTSERARYVWTAPEDQQSRLMKLTIDDVWELFDRIRFYRIVEVDYSEIMEKLK